MGDENKIKLLLVDDEVEFLRREKIVRSRKQAQSVSYSLSGDEATKVMETLHEVFCHRG